MRYIIRHIFIFTGILIFVAFLSRISKTALYDGFFSKIQEISVRNSQSVQVPALSETRVLADTESFSVPVYVKVSALFYSFTALSEMRVSESTFVNRIYALGFSSLYYGIYLCRAP